MFLWWYKITQSYKNGDLMMHWISAQRIAVKLINLCSAHKHMPVGLQSATTMFHPVMELMLAWKAVVARTELLTGTAFRTIIVGNEAYKGHYTDQSGQSFQEIRNSLLNNQIQFSNQSNAELPTNQRQPSDPSETAFWPIMTKLSNNQDCKQHSAAALNQPD